MTKLHELIAVEPDLKQEAMRVAQEITNLFTNGVVRLVGQVRKYTPLDDAGEKLMPETTELATTVGAELNTLKASYSRWLDVTIQKETTNGKTQADVTVDGSVVLKGLCAPALLNLESRLTALRAVYAAIPTNDPSEIWAFDVSQGVYVSAPKESYRTKKIPKALVGSEATKEHPAQIQYYTEDIREGTWSTAKRSGMLSITEKRKLLENIDTLAREVKKARQRANDADADTQTVAEKIFGFIHRE